LPRRARAYAARNGWAVAGECLYSDDGISGAEFDRRPGLVRLLNALKPTPPFQVLIVSDRDRIGREQIETSYVLKQILLAGVRVFEYQGGGRELTLDDPMDKLAMAVTNFAAELERMKASQRTRDALHGKAERGYVVGGTLFGYDNVAVIGETGKRQHVERRINRDEAAIVARVFEMLAAGMGFKKTAKTLNAEGVPSPRPRRAGRARAWTPSSIRAMVFNPLYTGRIVWGRTRKRDTWGRKKQSRRPEREWLRLPPREDLRIVSDDLWTATHARIGAARETYRASGRLAGRPPGGAESRYLLTGFAACTCGGGMVTASRASGSRRKRAYVCANHRERGNTVCDNRLHAPMEATDRAVLGAVERDLLRSEIVEQALLDAILELQVPDDEVARRRDELRANLKKVDDELEQYAEAIAAAGSLEAILAAMKEREARRAHLAAELERLESRAKIRSLDTADLTANLRNRLTDWQGLLQRQTPEARQILRRLLVGRLVFTPKKDETGRYYEFVGQGSISEVVCGTVLPKEWWPQREAPVRGALSLRSSCHSWPSGPTGFGTQAPACLGLHHGEPVRRVRALPFANSLSVR